jgi:hypothetical protein
LFDHHNRTVCGHNDAFLGRRVMPRTISFDPPLPSPEIRTLPALYCVTLCWVCFRQSLPLQKVRLVLGTLTCEKLTVSLFVFRPAVFANSQSFLSAAMETVRGLMNRAHCYSLHDGSAAPLIPRNAILASVKPSMRANLDDWRSCSIPKLHIYAFRGFIFKRDSTYHFVGLI